MSSAVCLRGWVCVFVAAVGLAMGACADPEEHATQVATAGVRAAAATVLDSVRGSVTATGAPRGAALLDRVLTLLPTGRRSDVIVFGSGIRPDGFGSVRVAFHRRGETGGGYSYRSVVARLCVDYVIDLAGAGAQMTDTVCDPSLPATTDNAGSVDVTVMLG